MMHYTNRFCVLAIILTAYSTSGVTVDPCQLLCHMEHSLDRCKLVTTTSSVCKNLFWESDQKNGIVVDTIEDVDLDHVLPAEVVELLKVPRGGCERICQSHDACVDIGSECKLNDVCLNLFWNRGSPVRSNMTTCYELSDGGCNDGTPVLCGKFTKKPEEIVPQAQDEDGLTQLSNLASNTTKLSHQSFRLFVTYVFTFLLVF